MSLYTLMTLLHLQSSFSKICVFTETEQNIIKYIIGYVMNTMYCSLEKSTEHRSDSNIKHMSILFAQKMFSIKDFFSKCHRILSFLQIWSHLLKKSLMEKFIFCAVSSIKDDDFFDVKNRGGF